MCSRFAGCSIDKIGSGYTLTATDGLYAPATSSTITVSVGPAAQLAFTTQPVGGVAESTNFATSPKVTVQDAGGNTVTTDTVNVTLGIASYSTANSGTTQGTLACSNNTVSAVAGVAIVHQLQDQRDRGRRYLHPEREPGAA